MSFRTYQNHSIKCIKHNVWELCDCGMDEIEEELASEEAEIETREDDSSDTLDPELKTAYLEAIGKDN